MTQRFASNQHLQMFDIGPMEIPTTPTLEAEGTFYVLYIGGHNTTSGDITLSIYDGQVDPMYVAKVLSVPAKSSFYASFPQGRPFVDGVYWVASAPGVHGWICGNYRGSFPQ